MLDSTWHFLCGVYQAASNQVLMYVDGVLQADAGTSSGNPSNTASLSFGCNVHANNYFFNGVLDDGRVYKRALSQAEIDALYNEPGEPASAKTVRSNQAKLDVVPNPSQGTFEIRTGFPAFTMCLRNACGRLVYSAPFVPDQKLDIASGVYVLELISEAGEKVQKRLVVSP